MLPCSTDCCCKRDNGADRRSSVSPGKASLSSTKASLLTAFGIKSSSEAKQHYSHPHSFEHMRRGRGGRTPRGGRGQSRAPVTPDVTSPSLPLSSTMSIDPRSGQSQSANQAGGATNGGSSPTERVVANRDNRRRSRRLAGETPVDTLPTASTTRNSQVTQSGDQPRLPSSDPLEATSSDPPSDEIGSSPPIPGNGDLPEGEFNSSPPIPEDNDPPSDEEDPGVAVDNTDVTMHSVLAEEGSSNSPEPEVQYIVTFERQPPQEVRTNTEMAAFIVSLQITENGVPCRPPQSDESSENFNAIATLITTDGQTPTVGPGNETVMPAIPAPGLEQLSAEGGVRWLFCFAPGVITASGYFQMHIAVVITRVSPPSDDEGDYMIIDSPIATLHINSRVFHVHPFAERRVSSGVSIFHLLRL